MYVCMCVCVCMYVCLCVCMYACMYICMHVCTYHICMSLCMYVCIYVYMCVCVYVCMYVCMYVCVYVCKYVCVYVCNNVCIYICTICLLSYINSAKNLSFLEFLFDVCRANALHSDHTLSPVVIEEDLWWLPCLLSHPRNLLYSHCSSSSHTSTPSYKGKRLNPSQFWRKLLSILSIKRGFQTCVSSSSLFHEPL